MNRLQARAKHIFGSDKLTRKAAACLALIMLLSCLALAGCLGKRRTGNGIAYGVEVRFVDDDGTIISTQDNIVSTELYSDESIQYWGVRIVLDAAGANCFAEATKEDNRGKAITILVTSKSGVEQVASVVTIGDSITNGMLVISMQSYDQAYALLEHITTGRKPS